MVDSPRKENTTKEEKKTLPQRGKRISSFLPSGRKQSPRRRAEIRKPESNRIPALPRLWMQVHVQMCEWSENGKKNIMKRCMHCGNYIPGGCDENCRIRTGGRKTSVCALKEACQNFIDKEEDPLKDYKKIDLRPRSKRKKKS